MDTVTHTVFPALLTKPTQHQPSASCQTELISFLKT